jgi:hypothetical protein
MTNCLARGKALTIYDVFAGKFDEIGATPSRQSKVEPISSMQLRKLGVFQSAPGDFGRALSVMRAKGSTETEANGQNPPESRPVSWPSLISAEDKHCLAGAGAATKGRDMSLSVDTWPSVDFRYTVRNTVVLRGLWQPPGEQSRTILPDTALQPLYPGTKRL